MRIIIINGPNINLIGTREPDIYGTESYESQNRNLKDHAYMNGIELEIFQSNHEGAIIDKIQEVAGRFNGIIINAAAFTHTSIAILDALRAVEIPTVEVHISDLNEREDFRQFSYISLYAKKTIMGNGFDGYIEAMDYLLSLDKDEDSGAESKPEGESESEAVAEVQGE